MPRIVPNKRFILGAVTPLIYAELTVFILWQKQTTFPDTCHAVPSQDAGHPQWQFKSLKDICNRYLNMSDSRNTFHTLIIRYRWLVNYVPEEFNTARAAFRFLESPAWTRSGLLERNLQYVYMYISYSTVTPFSTCCVKIRKTSDFETNAYELLHGVVLWCGAYQIHKNLL